MQSGEGALDHPSVDAQSGAVQGSPAGDGMDDSTLACLVTLDAVVAAAVGEDQVRSSAGVAHTSPTGARPRSTSDEPVRSSHRALTWLESVARRGQSSRAAGSARRAAPHAAAARRRPRSVAGVASTSSPSRSRTRPAGAPTGSWCGVRNPGVEYVEEPAQHLPERRRLKARMPEPPFLLQTQRLDPLPQPRFPGPLNSRPSDAGPPPVKPV